MTKKSILVFSFLLGFQSITFAANSNMTYFLKSCAYGTVGGAILGLGTLAISENPSGKMSNVSRGASLGLYAGIGYGFYSLNQQKKAQNTDVELGENYIYLAPIASGNKIQGAQVNWVPASF